jgi:cobalamin biosynthetic protein CobC
MANLSHGGRLHAMVDIYGGVIDDWLDLSTGIAPSGYPVVMPPADIWRRLPETTPEFINAAANYYGSEQLLPIAGSQSVIQQLPRLCRNVGQPMNQVWLPRVGYKEHQQAWLNTNLEIKYYENLPPIDDLAQHDIVILINPNNPTGYLASLAQVTALQQRLEELTGVLIIDEAFMDATPEHSALNTILADNLVILRSVGKFFGLAGIRLGFLFAQSRWRNACQLLLGPWSVNGPAQYMITHAFNDVDWQVQQRDLLDEASGWLHATLKHYLQLGSQGTGLFRTLYSPQAQAWFELLCQQQVYTRLTDEKDALRFGLPTSAQRPILVKALERLATGD